MPRFRHGGGVVAAGRAQQPAKIPLGGWIRNGPSTGNPAEMAGFRQGLKELGYVEGQNIIIDYGFGEGRVDRLADLAAELVQLQPDVIVAVGGLLGPAVGNATTVIPIVTLAGD